MPRIILELPFLSPVEDAPEEAMQALAAGHPYSMQSPDMKSFLFTAFFLALASISVPTAAFAEPPQESKPSVLLGLIENNGVVVPLAEYRNGRWHGNPEFSGDTTKPLPPEVWTGHFPKLAEWTPAQIDGGPFRTSLKQVDVSCGGNIDRGLLIENRSRPDPEEENSHCISNVALAYMSAGGQGIRVSAAPAQKSLNESDERELLRDADKRYSQAVRSYGRSKAGAGVVQFLKDLESYPLQLTRSWSIPPSETEFSPLTFYSFSKIYSPKGQDVQADHRIGNLHGWLRGTERLNTEFEVYDADTDSYNTFEPLGAIRIGEDEYVIAVSSGYESYGAEILKVEKTGLKLVLEIELGGC